MVNAPFVIFAALWLLMVMCHNLCTIPMRNRSSILSTNARMGHWGRFLFEHESCFFPPPRRMPAHLPPSSAVSHRPPPLHPLIIPRFVQWNSARTMKGGLKILLEFWAEEQAIAEAVNANNVVADLDFPLNPKNKPGPEQQTMLAAGGSGATAAPPGAGGGTVADKEPLGSSAGFNSNTVLSGSSVEDVDPEAVFKLQNPASSTEVLDLAKRVDYDSRGKIYAILLKIGFEGHETLTMDERQSLEILRLLPECLVLEQVRALVDFFLDGVWARPVRRFWWGRIFDSSPALFLWCGGFCVLVFQ